MHHRIGRLLLCAALLLPACGGGRVTYASQDAPDAVPDVHVVDAAADRAGDQPEPDISADAPSDVAQDGLPDAADQADAAIPSDAAGEHEADLPAPPDAPDAAKDAAEVPDSPGETEVFVPALQTEKIQEGQQDPWETVILFEVSHPGLKGEKSIDKTSHKDPEIAALFGNDTTPAAGRFLLHVGPGCMGATPDSAVMLVHGAGGNAQASFVEASWLSDGLAPFLTGSGLCVFAITFAHPFGSNHNQAIALAAALEQARLIAGLPKLDLVAHSKGGIVAAAYATGLEESNGLAYNGDIDRLVALGVPFGGIDFSFRHPAFNYPADLADLAMPSSWDKVLEYAVWKDIYDESIYGGAFDGILELTAAWDEVFPLSMVEQDWYTTYYGGQGFVSHSLGIAKAIEMGGGYMAALKERMLPDDVKLYAAVGGSALINGMIWEETGPSDGLVFKASASDTSIASNVGDVKEFPLLNHFDLVSAATAQQWVLESVEP